MSASARAALAEEKMNQVSYIFPMFGCPQIKKTIVRRQKYAKSSTKTPLIMARRILC